MTNEEARAYFIDSIEAIITAMKDENHYNYETQQIESVFMRRDFEAKELAVKALEKEIPKEPTQPYTRWGMGWDYHDYYCPTCDNYITTEIRGNELKKENGWTRCKECGQKILWKEGGEGE